MFLSDEENGALRGATPGPLRRTGGEARWVVRHGAGVTRFVRKADGIAQELAVFVARAEPVKLSLLTLTNTSDRPRRLTRLRVQRLGARPPAAGEPALRRDGARRGERRRSSRATSYDAERSRVAFAAASGTVLSATADRREFLGRNGSLARAAGLRGHASPAAFGAGLDPCAALQVAADLAPGETRQIVLLLGQGKDAAETRALLAAYAGAGGPDAAAEELRAVEAFWDETLSTRAGLDARRLLRPPREPLAPLPGPRVPALGALGLLPVERRLRIPRPAPGRARAPLRAAGPHARAPPARRRRGSSSRGRRPALVERPRPARASAPAARTISSGSRTRPRRT